MRLKTADRVYLVFDRYLERSLKKTEDNSEDMGLEYMCNPVLSYLNHSVKSLLTGKRKNISSDV